MTIYGFHGPSVGGRTMKLMLSVLAELPPRAGAGTCPEERLWENSVYHE